MAALLLCGCAPAQRVDAGAPERQLVSALQSRPLVLLGEVHDNASQHALRAAALRRVIAAGARPALLMEQFDRERQADLDRALAQPGVAADAVIAAAAPADPAQQGWDWAFYRPYVALAIEYKLPIVAVNVSRTDARRVLAEGLAPLGFDPAVPEDIRSVQARAIVDGHCGLLDAAQAGRMVGAQVARDQFMARALEAHAARGAVLVAGNGHVRRDVGVPRWLDPATRARSVSIGLLEAGDDADRQAYDEVIATARQTRPDPCEAMRAPVPRGR